MSYVSASPLPETALALVPLRRWSMVSVGTATALTWAQFEGILHPHHPAFFLFMLAVVAFYVATAVVVFLVARGLYRIARSPPVRVHGTVRPFVIWASSTVAIVAIAVAFGGVR